MLKIDLGRREPYWLDAAALGAGARIRVLPVTPAMILVARDAALRAIQAVAGAITEETADDDSILAGAEGQAAFTRALCQRGIVEWEGFGNLDGEAIEPTRENIDAILAEYTIFDFLDANYVGPELSRLQEKNASSPSPTGTSGVGKNTARAARRSRGRRAPRARTKKKPH